MFKGSVYSDIVRLLSGLATERNGAVMTSLNGDASNRQPSKPLTHKNLSGHLRVLCEAGALNHITNHLLECGLGDDWLK